MGLAKGCVSNTLGSSMSMTAPAYYVKGMAKQALQNLKAKRVKHVHWYLKEAQQKHSYTPGFIGKLLGFKPRECSFTEALAIETCDPNELSLDMAIDRAFTGLPAVMDSWGDDHTRLSMLFRAAEVASGGANGAQTIMALSVDDADLLMRWLAKEQLDHNYYWV
jgi:hypothetical protein